MLFIQQYFVKVLLPWRKCETSLIKLEHMLMEEIILINPTIITYSSFFSKWDFLCLSINLTWDEFLSSSPTAQTKRPPTLYSCCTASVVFWGTQFKFLPFLELLLKLLIMLPGSVELIPTLFDVDFKVWEISGKRKIEKLTEQKLQGIRILREYPGKSTSGVMFATIVRRLAVLD